VAHSTLRLAAGASVIAASFLIVAPNPSQAFADKHGADSHSNNEHKNGGSGRGGNAGSDLSSWVNGAVGSGGIGGDSKSEAESLAPQSQIAMRSAMVAEQPAGDNVTAAAPRGGSDYSGQPASGFKSPRVVVGNGRVPGTHTPGLDSPPEAVFGQDTAESPAAAPAVPEAVQIDIPPLPPPLPSNEKIWPSEFVVAEFGTGTADTVTDPLAGVAGLILIPAVGAMLGYRQARAAQSLRESLRT
jgi:hypothetical protein